MEWISYQISWEVFWMQPRMVYFLRLVKHLLYWTHLFGGANRASWTSHISFQPSEFVQCQKIPLLQSWVYLWKHHKQWDFLNPKNPGLCKESRAAKEGIWLSPTINLLMDKISKVGGRIITTGTLTNFINSFIFSQCLERKHVQDMYVIPLLKHSHLHLLFLWGQMI